MVVKLKFIRLCCCIIRLTGICLVLVWRNSLNSSQQFSNALVASQIWSFLGKQLCSVANFASLISSTYSPGLRALRVLSPASNCYFRLQVPIFTSNFSSASSVAVVLQKIAENPWSMTLPATCKRWNYVKWNQPEVSTSRSVRNLWQEVTSTSGGSRNFWGLLVWIGVLAKRGCIG